MEVEKGAFAEVMAKVEQLNGRIRKIEKERDQIVEGDPNAERMLKAKVKILERKAEEALASGDFGKEKSFQAEIEKLQADHEERLRTDEERENKLTRQLNESTQEKIQLVTMEARRQNVVDGETYHKKLSDLCEWYKKAVESYENLESATGVSLPIADFKRRLTVTDHSPQDAPGGNKELFRRLSSIGLL